MVNNSCIIFPILFFVYWTIIEKPYQERFIFELIFDDFAVYRLPLTLNVFPTSFSGTKYDLFYLYLSVF